MTLFVCLLVLILQTGVISSMCLPGYYDKWGYCAKCYLGCQKCNGHQCHNCNPPACVNGTDICDFANCDTEGCSGKTAVKCSGCPDGFYMENDFCLRCENINCKCSSASGCDECLPGFQDISAFCSTCVPGKFGSSCEFVCVTTCEDGTCNKELGTCLKGCASDEYLDSGECKPCPNRCESCVDSTHCTTCKQSFNWNPTCSYDCTGCISDCNRNYGCALGCSDSSYYHIYNEQKEGYECIRCPNQCYTCDNNTYCTSCRDNNWGRLCQYSCDNCEGTCNMDNGCIDNCELGYYREQVETGQECKPCSVYCKQCFDSSTCQVCKDGPDGCKTQACNDTNGECLHGCQIGYHGANCSLACPVTCSSDGCFQENGNCKSACFQGSADNQCKTVTPTQTTPEYNESATETQTDDDDDNIAIPAGAGAGAAIVIVVVIVVVVLLIRRRRRTDGKEGRDEMSLDDHKPSIENNAYATIHDAITETGPNARDDAVILNEKSPVIMSTTPDDINDDTHKTSNNPADLAASVKHKGYQKPNDVPIKSNQQQSNEGVSKEKPDSLKQVQKTPLDKHADKNARAIKETKRTESDTYENKTKEHTGYISNIPDDQSESQTEIDQILNQSNGDPEGDDNTYYNTFGKRVPVSQLVDYVNAKSFDDIENEFEKIPRGLLRSYSVAKASRNADKNRYKMIYPCPFARKDKESTTTDFWRMIWQEKCETIVMLTKCYENREHKCDQYWPYLGENKQYGKLSVTCVTEDQFADFTVRSFVVTQNEASLNSRQIHFTAWPDKGVPADVTSMIEYRQKVRSIHKDKETPMLVHCSAGIGRTGTFIALDTQTFVGESRGYVDIFGCVTTLRQQRVNMVQTPEQYEYLHLTVLHALTFDCKNIPAEEFTTYYSKIVKKKDGLSDIEQQFKNLASTLDALSEEDSDEIARNKTLKDKNRDGADIPGDENRVRLCQDRKLGYSDYINAVYINGYKTCNKFIVAQTPLPTTVVDFLSMIYQTNCYCVVFIEEPDLQDKTVGVFWPADNQVMKHGIFQVKCKESEICNSHSLKKLSIVRKSYKKEEVKEVNLFIFTNWPTDAAVPKSSDSLIQLIKTVDKINDSHIEGEENPIIVHCMNGATRSCLFCAVSVLIEKMEIEHEVSVVNTLRQIKSRRRSAFPTLEQYKFCYQAVISYLQTFDTYSNFELTTHSDNRGPGEGPLADVVYATVKK